MLQPASPRIRPIAFAAGGAEIWAKHSHTVYWWLDGAFVSQKEDIMAKKGPRQLIKLRSTESSHMYLTVKNRRNDPNRLELRRYDPTLRKHVIYRETK
jgi:large subunit ribosomal protein L33